MSRKLVILHVDGVSAAMLERALDEGDMPFMRHLLDSEGYEILRYRCGVPSTTPFAQAGILYGDNSEIPSFRWWDRERQVLVKFGAGSTFKKVADKYFDGCHPLTEDGACIAACFPAGAADDFGIAYQDRTYGQQDRSRSAAGVLLPYLANPIHAGDWVWQTVAMLGRTARDYAGARSAGRHPARAYVVTDVVEEIFVHHLTRYAVEKAMREGYSPIYAAFYAYDETAHAFGPGDAAARRVLKHVDHTIRKIAARRSDRYELVVLSDHGHVDTVPFRDAHGRRLDQLLEHLVPGRLMVTASGGLAHVYFNERRSRMPYRELVAQHSPLLGALQQNAKIALIMARDEDQDVFWSGGRELHGGQLAAVLEQYDDPEILLGQLTRLNSFASSGDLVLFGAFVDGKQANFETQAGGHGSVGGDQLHPFVLAKKEWSLDVSTVAGAHQLHPVLSGLRDRLVT